MAAKTVTDTKVYQLAFTLAMNIFQVTKSFPKEEKYSLTDQIRRSSRSVCICLREAYRKKRYPAHFIAKITDSDMENSETEGWLEFALACQYLSNKEYEQLCDLNNQVGKLLNHMLTNPDKY